MLLLVTVCFLRMSTFRTSLRSIFRINNNYSRLIHFRFILNHLAKLIERPTHYVPTVTLTNLFRSRTNSFQVFQYNQTVSSSFFNECLRYRMVNMRHPTVFSLTNGFQSPSGRTSSSLLKRFSDSLEVSF